MIVIGGVTATGKSDLAIAVAKKVNGEIIGADSMQIYKYMDIGTAKPDIAQRSEIPHHMIDILLPNERFSVAEYKKQASIVIDNIKNKGKVPIIVGGTGLYVNSLLYNYSPFAQDDKLRQALKDEYERFGIEYMHDKLMNIDAKSAEKIHKNNIKRVLRALEVKILTGESLVDKCDNENTVPALVYALGDIDRQVLYDKINERVDKMFEKGLAEEVDFLLSSGKADFNCQSMQAIGYKEFRAYYEFNVPIEEIAEKIKQHTRNYAKRQITWFKKIESVIWLGNQSLEEKSDRIVGDYYKYFCKL